MAFESILYPAGESGPDIGRVGVPEYFRDLNLDQVVDAITADKDEYQLKPFFYAPLMTRAGVLYRHDIMQDLEDERIRALVNGFATTMLSMRKMRRLAEKLYYKYQKERWVLHAAEAYCTALRQLQSDFSPLTLSSAGMNAFRDYLTDYVHSDKFSQLLVAVEEVTDGLRRLRFGMVIKENSFRVQNFDGEPDYSAEVSDVFRKFQEGAVNSYLVKFEEFPNANDIEAKILDFIALLNPNAFANLNAFCAQHGEFADPVLLRFDREIQFYVAHLTYLAAFKQQGLPFCYPIVSQTEKDVYSEEGFDLALVGKLLAKKKPIVRNDFYLSGGERIFIVSGPNQGGKTTFARTFGQLHHFASLGCQVPGKKAKLFLFDTIFTHFEREETIKTLNGKLQDDLIRVYNILGAATSRSIIIMNEIFTSTSLQDAVFLARKILENIIDLDSLCVCVTFLEELASLGERTVSMVSTVDPERPASRTFKVIRRPANGRSYAVSIAEKYQLTYEFLLSRMKF